MVSPLEWIRETLSLLKEESVIFASQDDADYFRSLFKGKKKSLTKEPPISQMFYKKKQESPVEPFALKAAKINLPTLKKKDEEEPFSLKIEPKPPSTPVAFTPNKISRFNSASMHSLFAKIAPEIPLFKEIPSDAFAKRNANRWKTRNQTAPISVLFLSEPEKQRAFLKELSIALDVYFDPSHLIQAEQIEKENQWEAFLSADKLKMVFAVDSTLWQLSRLMQHYKENPTTGMRSLKKIPLFLLPDLSLYLKDPLLKRSLWKAICQKLSS